MNNQRLQEEVDGAWAYERLHVPSLFVEWTAPVLTAARVGQGHRVLDVACGTGVLSRAAVSMVGPDGSVTGVDPNRGMLNVAQALSDRVSWKEGVADSLPSEDASFDRVVSQFGIMFFPDRRAALREMFRVLVPGGRMAIAAWASLDATPAYARIVDLFERMAGQDAANALRVPFAMGERCELEELLRSSGGQHVEGMTRIGRASFPSLRSLLEAELRGWLPIMGVDLEEELIQSILETAKVELAEYVTTGGRAEFASPAHIVSCEKNAL